MSSYKTKKLTAEDFAELDAQLEKILNDATRDLSIADQYFRAGYYAAKRDQELN